MSGDNNNKTNAASLAKQFLLIAQPDEDGFSRPVTIEELLEINKDFQLGNGGSWCRDDGPLKKYNIIRHKTNGNKGKIISVQLDGFNKNQKKRRIAESIRKEIVKKPCAVLAINSNIECDHKDGMYDDDAVSDPTQQLLEHFQPLSKAVNGAKRTHCNRCKDNGERFDAKVLGYSASFIKGSKHTKSCVGCYWYDPNLFNATISKCFVLLPPLKTSE